MDLCRHWHIYIHIDNYRVINKKQPTLSPASRQQWLPPHRHGCLQAAVSPVSHSSLAPAASLPTLGLSPGAHLRCRECKTPDHLSLESTQYKPLGVDSIILNSSAIYSVIYLRWQSLADSASRSNSSPYTWCPHCPKWRIPIHPLLPLPLPLSDQKASFLAQRLASCLYYPVN